MNSQSNHHPIRVTVALDGSAESSMALPIARLAATQLEADLAIVHVTQEDIPAVMLGPMAQLSPTELVGVDLHVHHGDPATALLQMTETPGMAMLVLTTHGRHLFPEHGLGSITEALVAGTTRPIMLVRPEAPNAIQGAMQRWLIPVDGSSITAQALCQVIHLADRLHAAIDFLHVVSPQGDHEVGSYCVPSYLDHAYYDWSFWSTEFVEWMGACAGGLPFGTTVQASLAQGEHISEEILQAAQDRHADLLVLVRRSHLEAGHARTLRALVAATPCPILLTGVPSSMEWRQPGDA